MINVGHMQSFQAINTARNIPTRKIRKLLEFKEKQNARDRNLRLTLGIEMKQVHLQRNRERMENLMKIKDIHD